MAKVLILDIETSPALAYVWRFFKENISPKQVLSNSYIMSYAAKWLGEDEVYYDENRHDDEKDMLVGLYNLLDEADIVVAHNGNKFDLPKIRGRALVHGLTPPSPYKTVDTLLVARRQFGFEANSLEHLCNVLGVRKKTDHAKFPGFELWVQCLKQNDEAWAEMQEYNIDDILALEELYVRMRPYIVNHPNVGVYNEPNEVSCPKCGSGNSQRRGFQVTSTAKYQRYRCNDCGGWHRSRTTEYPKDLRKILTVNA